MMTLAITHTRFRGWKALVPAVAVSFFLASCSTEPEEEVDAFADCSTVRGDAYMLLELAAEHIEEHGILHEILERYLDDDGQLLSYEEALMADNPTRNPISGWSGIVTDFENYLLSAAGVPYAPGVADTVREAQWQTRSAGHVLSDDVILHLLANKLEYTQYAFDPVEPLQQSDLLADYLDDDGKLIPFEDALLVNNPTRDVTIGRTTITRVFTEYFTTHDIPASFVVDTYRYLMEDCVTAG
ncbi:hypothetical protein IEU95_15920 [Hoyosella rhizosphaerae]|uniref:Uncharacterized protein n=1 Tax=Hoyosella rhizosphaerae TaxID=1755582 RepID=A0A916UHS6_9ACTN|nr:hypothetical protein [Hoyosella rhizosphaerae]MBN4928323.1 hypothetical protein [Hoyosella rhizosphaerae]GGC74089.1 hypothetical protein GCM10011410_29110 [Hoyosella rhizosphaerae]